MHYVSAMSAPSIPVPHPLVRVPAPIIVLAGLWLIISPWFLPGGYPPAAEWTDMSAGIVAMVLGSWVLLRPLDEWIGWALIALSLWLLFSPWITGYAGHPVAKYNASITATIIVFFSSWGLIAAITVKGLQG
jgi:hypothetical protein